MYLRLTSRCNMTCAHCCFSDTSKGVDMTPEVFYRALNVAVDYGHLVTLGGGEPTVHPLFFQFLDKAIEYAECGALDMAPLVVTNGKRTKLAHRLLDYALEHERAVSIELSQDEYHSPIDSYVVSRFYQAYKRQPSWNPNPSPATVGIRTVSHILPVGRALVNGLDSMGPFDIPCCCSDVTVDPAGDVYSCGCMHTKLGRISDPSFLQGYDSEYAHIGGYAPVELEEA